MKKILIFSALVMITACSGKGKPALAAESTPPQTPATAGTLSTTAELPPGHPAIEPAPGSAPSAPQPAGRVSGQVLETMNAGGYTYVRLKTASGDKWAAVRETKVMKGSTVAIDAQMVAENFESKSLNRTFGKIIFGVMADGNAPAAAPAASMPMTSATGTPAQHMAAPPANVKVEKALGGKTVAEIWAARKELSDKPVVVRGKVVKFLSGIMGRNWLHVRDGSGSHEKGDDDITVTTMDVVRVGDVVTVSGTVHIDVDFGAGYLYPVIIEDASLKK